MAETKQIRWMTAVAKKIRDAEMTEADLVWASATLEANTTRTRELFVAKAYSDGLIDGRNAELRKAQETQILEQSPELKSVETAVNQARKDLALLRATRHYYENLLKIGLAMLHEAQT